MRLKQTIYLVLFVCSLIIGIHQTWYHGFLNSYWLFMFSLVFIGLFRLDVAKRGIPKVDAFVAEQAAKPIPKAKSSNKKKT